MKKNFSFSGLAKAIGLDIFLPKKSGPVIPCGKVRPPEEDKHYSHSRRRLHDIRYKDTGERIYEIAEQLPQQISA